MNHKSKLFPSVLLSTVLLSSCAAVSSAPAVISEDLPAITDAVPTNATAEKYQDILEGIYYDNILPDGQRLDPYDDPAPVYPNQFAIYDVDGDGKDELIIRYINTYTAGMFGAVYGYDAPTDTLTTQLFDFTALSFYQNGVVEVGRSHNQGLGGRFWPSNFYQYAPETDTYVFTASVDAWDKLTTGVEVQNNIPFPEEIDTDSEGIVFYIRPAGTEGTIEPVSYSAYQRWYNELIGFDANLHTHLDFPIEVPYQSLTTENIAAIL